MIRPSLPSITRAPQFRCLLDAMTRPFVDREAHRTALLVEEAGIDRDHNGIGRNDLLYGAPRRGISSGD